MAAGHLAVATLPVIRRVTVFGSSTVRDDSDEYKAALELGRLLAEAGVEVINGGQLGTMDGVARGVLEAGGRCIGITVAGAPWGPPSSRLTELRVLDDLFLRTRELVTLGDAWIALPGQVGTLAEVALCWALVGGGLLEPRPLVLVGRPWQEAVPLLVRHLGIRQELASAIRLVADASEAMRTLGLGSG